MSPFTFCLLTFSITMGSVAGLSFALKENETSNEALLDKSWRMYKYSVIGGTWPVSIPLLKLYQKPPITISFIQ